jgi:hypothetical protein
MLHKNVVVGDNHYLQQWEPADSTARLALTVTTTDVGKVARQLDTNVFYLLMDDSPVTWTDISTTGSGTVTSVTSANADATVATTTTTPVITIVQTPALRSATTTVAVASATAPTSGQVLTATSGTAATWQTPAASSGITLGTPQSTTSGTTIDFTGIPSGTKMINIMMDQVSTSGTSKIVIRIGDSGGLETSGYLSVGGAITSAGAASAGAETSGYSINASAAIAAFIVQGLVTLSLLSSSTNTWVVGGILGTTDTARILYVGGSKSLSAELDRVSITTVGGADTFDAGTINISYLS